jgi:hypothetical protein
MLQRVFLVEPGIQSTVGKDTVGLSSALGGEPDSDTGKGPDPLHDDAVETVNVGPEPADQTGGKTIAAERGRTESVDRTGEVFEERCLGRIKGNDFQRIPNSRVGPGQLANHFRRPTVGRGETANNVENMQLCSLRA